MARLELPNQKSSPKHFSYHLLVSLVTYLSSLSLPDNPFPERGGIKVIAGEKKFGLMSDFSSTTFFNRELSLE